MKLHKLFLFALSAVATLAVVGCTKAPKADSPEAALHAYISTAFDAHSASDRQKLMELSTGDAKGFLERMSDADFKKQFIDSKLRFISMQAKDKRTDDKGDVSLVYELNYKDASDPSPATYMNKKIAYLTRDGGTVWRIKATKNVKSFIERKDDLVITPESTGEEKAPEKK